MNLTENVNALLRKIQDAGGEPFVVGGAVRDYVLSCDYWGECSTPKDLDIEVYGLTQEALSALLPEERATPVGKSFGVCKLRIDNTDLDISLPRFETKKGAYRQDYEVTFDPFASKEEACRRRDFTINAMMWDPQTRQLIDPFGGYWDLIDRVLKHVDSRTFQEDELRPLRGMQFCARFNLTPNPTTIALCKWMNQKNIFEFLPEERIREEWLKWALKSVKPSKGIDFLLKTAWLENFQRLHNLDGCIQDPHWHPEGDALTHSALAADVMCRIIMEERIEDTETQLILMFAALLHDIGKPYTTEVREDGKITSYNHASVGSRLVKQAMQQMGFHTQEYVDRITPLVKEHMCHIDWSRNFPSAKALRRASVRLAPATIEELFWIFEADVSSRPPKEPDAKMVEVIQKAKEVGVFKGMVEQLVKGRHIISEFSARRPGPWVGEAVRAAYSAQMDGEFNTLDGGIAWLRKFVEGGLRADETIQQEQKQTQTSVED